MITSVVCHRFIQLYHFTRYRLKITRDNIHTNNLEIEAIFTQLAFLT